MPEPIRTLLVTGYPGWLTEAFFNSLVNDPMPGLRTIRVLAHPSGERIAPSAGAVRVETMYANLADSTSSLAGATDGMDAVLHAAAILHVRRVREWSEVNTEETGRLVSAAVQSGVRRFVLISSNAAAGRSPARTRPLTEDDEPLPRSHYGRSKLLAERLLMARSHAIEAVILRPCMFYGPPVPPRHVDVYRRILEGRMPLIGSGSFARSLTYIDNMIQGVRLGLVHPRAAGQTFFISDHRVYTTREVTDAMARALGVRARFLRLPRLVAPLAHQLDSALSRLGLYWQNLHLVGEADWEVGVSCEKARRELGYQPAVELEEGMRRAVSWCRSTGKLPASRA